MTVRGGGVPRKPWLSCRCAEWVRRLGASLPMRTSASWFGSLRDPPNTRLRHDMFVPESGLPSESSSRPQRACCRARSRQGVAWQRRGMWKVGATANLDSSCARRRLEARVGTRKWASSRTKKLKKESQRTGVQKAPRHEVAGSWALAGSECYGDYVSVPSSMVGGRRA